MQENESRSNGLPETLSFKEVMDHLKVSKPTCLKYIREGKIPGFKLGYRWIFYKRDFENLRQTVVQ